jgi:hypothetical protein
MESKESREVLKDKVMRYFDSGETALRGKVFIQGTRIENEKLRKRVTVLKPLYFEPDLRTVDNFEKGLMAALLKYLRTYAPVSSRGLVFYPSADYSLKVRESGLVLYMQDKDKEWAPGETIDVFDLTSLNAQEFEDSFNILNNRKVSSFVFGKVIERKDYIPYTVIRRHFKE